MERYIRQLNLPEITPAHQKKLKNTRLLMVGAGGLGAPALPYLAAAGIGHISIMDHDTVDPTNLHRQTIYKDTQTGQSKAELAAAYLRDLNPDIEVVAITKKLCHSERSEESQEILHCVQDDITQFDIILDGSDNFKTKSLLNEISVRSGTPLVSASVNQFDATIGIFSGGIEDAPCYHCLFPQLPAQARNCNEAGILGTSAGITGMYQAHFTLCYLLGIGNINIGSILNLDLKAMRTKLLTLASDPACAVCSKHKRKALSKDNDMKEIPLLARTDLSGTDHVVIDVREDYEVEADPIDNVVHIPMGQLPGRAGEIPNDKMLAFVCASNVRSRKAAEYFAAIGYNDVCVLDKKTA